MKNRIIKFRVWLKDINRFMYPISWADLAQMVTNNEENPSNLVFQQFTGLTDKNGKEIYEGDILSTLAGMQIGEIKFFNAEFCCHLGGASAYNSLSYCLREYYCVNVIGNIFENPSLIK